MSQPATDEKLLAEFVGGRTAALGELARRYEGPLLGLSQGLLSGDVGLAADAVQETWVRVIRFGGQFNGRCRFKTWLYRIAINQCRSLATARPAVANCDAHAAADPSSKDATPLAAMVASERTDALRSAVDALDAEQRVILLLCYHEGMTHPQAAEILEIPVGTLKSRLGAALGKLRERLGSEKSS